LSKIELIKNYTMCDSAGLFCVMYVRTKIWLASSPRNFPPPSKFEPQRGRKHPHTMSGSSKSSAGFAPTCSTFLFQLEPR